MSDAAVHSDHPTWYRASDEALGENIDVDGVASDRLKAGLELAQAIWDDEIRAIRREAMKASAAAADAIESSSSPEEAARIASGLDHTIAALSGQVESATRTARSSLQRGVLGLGDMPTEERRLLVSTAQEQVFNQPREMIELAQIADRYRHRPDLERTIDANVEPSPEREHSLAPGMTPS